MTWTGPSFLQLVVQPALIAIGLSSPPAETLVLATAIHESGEFRWNVQNGGPAMGYVQMEPATEKDIWLNVLKYQSALSQRVASLLNSGEAENAEVRTAALRTNDKYAAAICCVEYYRFEPQDPLPTNQNDIAAMASYWKRHYNTSLGGGKESDFRAHWDRVMSPPAPINN